MAITPLLDTSLRLTDAVYRGVASSGGGGSVSSSEIGVAGEAIVPGNVVYLKTADGYWYKAKADAEATSGPVEMGIAVSLAGGAGLPVTVFRRGLVSVAGWGLTLGVCYVSETVAGGVQSSATTTAGHVGRIVGWARSTIVMYVDPSPDWVVQ
jgi:hypothetical protein